MIPSTHHLIWVTGNDLPPRESAWAESWRKHNPEWTQILWTLATLPYDKFPPVCSEMLRHPDLHWVLKSDIARWLVVWLYGGVYSDTDMECCKPVSGFLSDKSFIAHSVTPNIIGNALFGAEKGNVICLEIACATAEKISKNMKEANENIVDYGVNLAGKFHEGWGNIYPEHYFYPTDCGYRNRNPDKIATPDEFPNAYAIHHWTGGTKDGWYGSRQKPSPVETEEYKNRSWMFYGRNSIRESK